MSAEARAAQSERMKARHALAREGKTMVAEKPVLADTERLERARARSAGRSASQLTPLEQIRPYNPNSVPDKSAGAYYLRPDGATISDTLIWYPNGAQHDREYDPQGKYSENAAYYQERQRRKGFEYVGPALTESGITRLIEIMERNKDAEVERLEDEILLADDSARTADRPEVRDQQRKRRARLQDRLKLVQTGIQDPAAVLAQLREIANAQEMASVPAQVMRVMRRMLGQQNDALIARFTRQQGIGEPDPAMEQGKAILA